MAGTVYDDKQDAKDAIAAFVDEIEVAARAKGLSYVAHVTARHDNGDSTSVVIDSGDVPTTEYFRASDMILRVGTALPAQK